MTEQRFDDDRVRQVIRKAADFDSREADTVSESELKGIAEDVGVSASALQRALSELQGDISAKPPPPPSAGRRWGPLAVVIALLAAAFIVSPGIVYEFAIPFTVLILLSVVGGVIPKLAWHRRESTMLALDGVRYRTSKGERLLPWSSVIHLKSGVPGTLEVVTPSDSVTLVLTDFGDPDAVMAAIKLRLANAALGRPQA